MLNLISSNNTDILAYIRDLEKIRTPKELIKINIMCAKNPNYITKEHLIVLEEIATELLKNDRFQIQTNPAGYCLIKRDETIAGYHANNILGISTCLAKARKLSLPIAKNNINNIEEIKFKLLDTFQNLLKDNYISMFIMFDPAMNDKDYASGFVVKYGQIPLTEKE